MALGVLGYTLVPFPPGIEAGPFRELGARLAKEAAALRAPGSRVVLVTRDNTQFKTPAYEAMTAGFLQAFAKSGGQPPNVRVLKVDPLRVVSVPPVEYVELFRRLEDQDVIVSFLGPPQLDAGQLASIGQRRPRVLAVCSGNLPRQLDLKRLFDDKLLHLAVLSRMDAPAAAKTFEDRFRVVTAANLNDLPMPRAALP